MIILKTSEFFFEKLKKKKMGRSRTMNEIGNLSLFIMIPDQKLVCCKCNQNFSVINGQWTVAEIEINFQIISLNLLD